MNIHLHSVTLAAVAAVLFAGWIAQADAQPRTCCRGGGGWGPQSNYGRLYNAKTVETLTGEIASVEEFTPIRGMGKGIHILLQTGKEKISVHLGPSWYLENQDFNVSAKDKVEITGSRVTMDGKPVIIAREIKKGSESLMLRDENGIPAWSASRRK